MAREFNPNVQIFDEDGVCLGHYLREGVGDGRFYTDQFVWDNGGRVLLQRDLDSWGYEVREVGA